MQRDNAPPQMATGSPPSEQLTVQGVPLPAWPEELEEPQDLGERIQPALSYAEGIKLWRAQLRSALAADPATANQLLALVRQAGRRSAWDRDVIHYLLIDLQPGSKRGRLQAAAQLVGADARTPAQLLGASLELAGSGWLASALHGIKRVVQGETPDPHTCLEICARLVAALQHTNEQWGEAVQIHLEATRLLATAASHASGEASLEAVLERLETLGQLAGQKKGAGNEHCAIQQVVAREQHKRSQSHGKPLLRTIHHLACTGGTVISKCLAAMPQVALISEVNPLNRFGSRFEPTNPLLQLERSYRQLSKEEIKADFLRQIGHAHEICTQDDVDLILRDHSHTDFCMGTKPAEVCPIVDYLGDEYALRSVITVRHPLDSYLGLLAAKWENQFSPSTLDEYSRRYLAFLERYADLPLRRYEDFCKEPEAFMEELCGLLEISYSADFLEYFGDISLSGDSGRKGLDGISLRPRREIPEEVAIQADSSQAYAALIDRLAYGKFE